MYLSFRETFELPVSQLFPYFESPASWGKLYGIVEPARALADGWVAVPLKRFPFPLVAKNVEVQYGRRVRWIFGGFWRGVGQLDFHTTDHGTTVEGFEYITAHGLWLGARFFEKRFMEKEFERIWALGWQRIRRGRRAPT